eukprot:TRINITY_DN20992_c0_g1_i1.p1 TRINITY_DN20992_c0_g1~~TRINITY_DN20992_c0_g1_i1.p1  ORF type:complete len:1225 (+),score=161.71 TRINITY_DN20992_c0_g1_i1:73-3675(+)
MPRLAADTAFCVLVSLILRTVPAQYAPGVGLRALHFAAVLPTPWQPLGAYAAPCSNVSDLTCVAGFPICNAFLRARQRNLTAEAQQLGIPTVANDSALPWLSTIVVVDDSSKLTQFHPDGFALNAPVFGRMGAVAWMMDEMTVFSSTSPTVQQLFRSPPVPLPLFSNMVLTTKDTWYGLVHREMAVRVATALGKGDAGGNSTLVGLIVVMDPQRSYVWPLLPVVDAVSKAVDRLRNFHKVSAVAVFYTRALVDDWSTLIGLDIDLIVCGYPTTKGVNASLQYVNNNRTAVIFRSSMVNGVLFADIDPDARAARQPFARFHEVDAGVRLPANLVDENFAADAAWLQDQVALASKNDPLIGTTAKEMPHGTTPDNAFAVCRYSECEIGNLICDSLYSLRPVDVALLNGGAVRTGWAAGDTRLSALYGALPFVDNICFFAVNGLELYRVVNRSAAIGAPTAVLAPYTGPFLQVRGLRITYNPSLSGPRLLNFEIWSRSEQKFVEVERSALYRVAAPWYLCQGGDGYNFHFASEVPVERTTSEIHSVIAEFVQRNSPIVPTIDGRLVISTGTEPLVWKPETPADCRSGQQWDATREGCVLCPAGTYQRHAGALEPCQQCPAGMAARGTGNRNCTACPEGYAQPLRGQADCVECPAGTESLANSSTCSPCPVSQYNNRSASRCSNCPPNTVSRTRAATSLLQCECAPGYYSPALADGLGKGCIACPVGMDCSGGGNDVPRTKAGYYTASNEPFSVFECLPQQSCAGGSGGPLGNVSDTKCAEPYTGFVCADCYGEYYRSRKGCTRCESAQHWFPPVIAVGLVLLAGAAYAAEATWNTPDRTVCMEQAQPGTFSVGLLRNVIGILIDFSMALFSITRTTVSTASNTSALFRFVGALAFQVDIPLPCLTKDITTSIALQVSVVFIVVIAYVLMAAVKFVLLLGATLLGLSGSSVPTAVWVFPARRPLTLALLRWYFFLYMPVLNSCLDAFRCYRHPNGSLSLSLQPSVLCSASDATWTRLVSISAVGLALGVLAPTAACVLVLCRDRDLRPAVTNEFLRGKYYWRVLILGKRTLLSLATIASRDPTTQLYIIFFILLGYLTLTAVHQPWTLLPAQRMDTVAAAVATAFVASFLPTEWVRAVEWSVIRVSVALSVFALALVVIGQAVHTAMLAAKLGPAPVIGADDGDQPGMAEASLYKPFCDPEMQL